MPASHGLIIAGVVAALSCATVAAEVLRSHREKLLGDPHLLGIAEGWRVKAARASLFVAAVGAVSMIVVMRGEAPGTGLPVPELAFLIDAGKGDPLAVARGAATDAIRALAAQFPGARVAVFRSTEPLQELAPATLDLEGALILVDRVVDDEAAGTSLAGPAGALLESGDARRSLVVVTRQTKSDIERLFAREGLSPALAVCVGEDGRGDFGAQTTGGRWVWASEPGRPASLVRETNRTSTGLSAGFGGFDPVQLLAAFALLLLAAERLLHWRHGYRRGDAQ